MAPKKVTVEVEGRKLALSNLDKVLYPDAGLHQGRGHRLLRRGRRRAAPPPRGPAAHPQALAGRHRIAAVLREERAARHARLGPHRVHGRARRRRRRRTSSRTRCRRWSGWPTSPPSSCTCRSGRSSTASRRTPTCSSSTSTRAHPPTSSTAATWRSPCSSSSSSEGLTAYPKTSGNKGAQLYVPIEPTSSEHTSAYAKKLADQLAAALPDLVLSSMDRRHARARSSSTGARTTAPRPRSRRTRCAASTSPTVSTPLTWDEVADAQEGRRPGFTTADVVSRVEELGDLLADMPDHAAELPK